MFRMLYHYLDHKRKESSAQIHATYLVSGKSVDDGQTVGTVGSRHRLSVVGVSDELFLLRATGCLLSEKTSWKV